MAPLATPRRQHCAYAADVAVERDDARGARTPPAIYAPPSSPPPPFRPPRFPAAGPVLFIRRQVPCHPRS